MWRHVTVVAKFLNLNNLSWQRQPFTLSNDGRKEWASVYFLSAIIPRKVIYDNFLRSFLSYLPNHGLLRSRNLLPWQRDITTSPLYWTTGFRQDKRRNLIIIFFYFRYLFIYSFEGRNFGRTIVTLALTLLWMKKRKTKIMSVRICLRKKRKMTKKTFSMYGVTSHIPSTLAAVIRSLYIV